MSKITGTTAPLDIRPFEAQVFDTWQEASVLELHYAERYEQWPTVVRFAAGHETVHYEPDLEHEGWLWRFAGRISIVEARRKFFVTLWPGAVRGDLERLERHVADVKAGHQARMPFQEVESNNVGTYLTMCPGFRVRVYRPVPGHNPEPAVACDDVACDESWHWGDVGDECVLHTRSVTQTVSLERMSDKESWSVEINSADSMSSTEASSLANDLQWAAAECKALNERRTIRG